MSSGTSDSLSKFDDWLTGETDKNRIELKRWSPIDYIKVKAQEEHCRTRVGWNVKCGQLDDPDGRSLLTVMLTDFRVAYMEQLTVQAAKDRLQKLNPNLEGEFDDLRSRIPRIVYGNGMNKAGVEIIEKDDGVILPLKASYSGLPFKWELRMCKLSQSQFYDHVTGPLLRVLQVYDHIHHTSTKPNSDGSTAAAVRSSETLKLVSVKNEVIKSDAFGSVYEQAVALSHFSAEHPQEATQEEDAEPTSKKKKLEASPPKPANVPINTAVTASIKAKKKKKLGL